MLDVHILAMNYTPRVWLMQCISSVYDAADHAGFPVAVHVIPGIPGHIGNGRAKGYSLGSNPYVTYVDDDDYLHPEAFAVCEEALMYGEKAVFPGEWELQNGFMRPGANRHHLCMYRREDLIDHTKWSVCGDLAQSRVVGGVEIDCLVYVHRLYQSEGRKLRRLHHDELREARG